MIRGTLVVRAAALALLAGLIALWSGSAPDVAAHAEFVGSAPAAGQVLATLPTEVRAWFSEDVSPLAEGIEVWTPAGGRVDDGNTTEGATAKSLRVGLNPSSEQGTYTVVWNVISVDGHPIRGSFVFSVGAPSDNGNEMHVPGGAPQWVSIAGGFARAIAYGLGLATIGLITLAVALGSSPGGDSHHFLRIARAAALMLVPAAALVLVAEILAITGGDAGNLADAATREAAWDARHVPSATIVAAGAIATATATFLGGRWRNTACVIPLMVIAGGFAWAGHAAAEARTAAWIAIDAVHVLAVGAWFGGIAGLSLTGRGRLRRGDGLAELPGRFSRIATVALPVAVVTGTALTLVIGPGIGNLLETGYGTLLVVKVAIVAATIVLAALNRQVMLPRLRFSEPGLARTFLRLVSVEAAALVVVVGLTATLVGQSPIAPRRTPPATPPELFDGTIGPYHFVFGTAPARAGANDITIDFHILGDRATVSPEAVSLSLSHKRVAAQVEVDMQPGGPGRFSAEDVVLPEEGAWMVTMHVLVPGSGQETLIVPLDIARGE